MQETRKTQNGPEKNKLKTRTFKTSYLSSNSNQDKVVLALKKDMEINVIYLTV